MPHNKSLIKGSLNLFIAILGSGAVLSGCESWNPTRANIFPDGYVSQDGTPLSSPPRTQPWLIEQQYDPAAYDLGKEQWLHAAGDLVASVAEQRGGLPDKVFLKPADTDTNAITHGFDSYLREHLISRGAAIATEPASGLTRLVYDISAPDKVSPLTSGEMGGTRTQIVRDYLKGLEGRPVLRLTLALKSEGKTHASAHGLYYVHGQDMTRYEWTLLPVPAAIRSYPREFRD
jgi:hypothetical protein